MRCRHLEVPSDSFRAPSKILEENRECHAFSAIRFCHHLVCLVFDIFFHIPQQTMYIRQHSCAAMVSLALSPTTSAARRAAEYAVVSVARPRAVWPPSSAVRLWSCLPVCSATYQKPLHASSPPVREVFAQVLWCHFIVGREEVNGGNDTFGVYTLKLAPSEWPVYRRRYSIIGRFVLQTMIWSIPNKNEALGSLLATTCCVKTLSSSNLNFSVGRGKSHKI